MVEEFEQWLEPWTMNSKLAWVFILVGVVGFIQSPRPWKEGLVWGGFIYAGLLGHPRVQRGLIGLYVLIVQRFGITPAGR